MKAFFAAATASFPPIARRRKKGIPIRPQKIPSTMMFSA